MHYLLMYEVVEDYVERRKQFREAHLAAARAAVGRGELVLAGAFAEPVDGAALLFQASSASVAEAFAREDPYVKNGLVVRWRVRPWTTVIGPEASVRLEGDPSSPVTAETASRSQLVRFLRTARHWVVATTATDGSPQSAVIGVCVTDGLELVFDTLVTTRKAHNLRRDARVALVMWSGAATAQIEGVADEPSGPELEPLRAAYLAAFPDGHERAALPDITYVRVRPTWIRTTDFGSAEPNVVELASEALRDLPA